MWAGAPQWANWALQPQQFQNMNHDEVDWAALAKQWIQMKETVDVPPLSSSSLQAPTSSASILEQISAKPAPKNEEPPSFISHHQPPPPPPPGPPPSQFHAVAAKAEEEGELQIGGEMDMEIEDDKDNVSNGESAHTSLPASNNSDEPWQEWWNGTSAPAEGAAGWGWGWGPGDATHPVVPDLEPPGTSEPTPHSHYSTKQHQMGNYNWGHDMLPEADQIAMRGVTDYGHRSRRSKPPFAVDMSLEAEKEADFHLDAAQRKKLPLWIREGLEKMEREKQRKFEREQEVKHKEEILRRKKEAENQARKIFKEGFVTDGVGNIVPSKSKFESDSEESNHSDREPEAPPIVIKKNSRFDVAPPPNEIIRQRLSVFKDEPDEKAGIKFAKLTEEEKLEQMMIKLRRWMTEILLDVTTSMILEVASEAINKARIKAPQVQVKKSSALTTLSRGLGLSIYSDSEDEMSDDGGKRNGGPHQDEESDSDDDLKETIARKKKEFEATEKSILQKLQKFEDESRAREMSVESARSSISRSPHICSDQEKNAISRSPSNDKSDNNENPTEESLDIDQSDDSDESDSQSDSDSKSEASTFDDRNDSQDSSVMRKESSEEELTEKKKIKIQPEDRKLKRSSSRDSIVRQSSSRERVSDISVSRDRTSRRSVSKERKLKKPVSKERKSKRSNSGERRLKRLSSQERKARRSPSRDRKLRRSPSRERKLRRSPSRERRSRPSVSRERTFITSRYREDRHRRQSGRISKSPHRRKKRSSSINSRRHHSRNRSLSLGIRPESSSRERSKRISRISSRDKRYFNHSRSRSKSRDRKSQRTVSIDSRSPRSISCDIRLKKSVSRDRNGSHVRSRHVSSRRRSSRNESPIITGRHSSSSSRSRRKGKRARKRSSSSSNSSLRKAKLRHKRSSSSDSSSEANKVKRKKRRKKNRRHSAQGSSS